ncbi:unnamed protein product [Rhodiola kirilowii]
MTSVRCVLVMAAAHGWPLYQLRVNNAFLQGVLNEDIYMKLPLGFYAHAWQNGQVCKLLRNIDGLK